MAKEGGRTVVKLCLLAMLTLPSLVIAPAAWAQAVGCWTTVGSAGTVDEEDLNTVALGTNDTAVRSTVANATVNVRYNVVNVPENNAGPGKELRARLADNGTASRVTVRLHRQNIFNGQDAVIGEIDSNGFDPSTVAQVRSTRIFGAEALFNFEDNVYYVDVSLVKTSLGGTPLIRAIRICPINLPPF
jgi:hypothetical protein